MENMKKDILSASLTVIRLRVLLNSIMLSSSKDMFSPCTAMLMCWLVRFWKTKPASLKLDRSFNECKVRTE